MCNLRPEFKFCLNTTLPHLPFADNHFSLIFCNSIFTHIDDMFLTWFSEMNRIIEPGGYFYFSVHDENSIEIMKTWGNISSAHTNHMHQIVTTDPDIAAL